MNTIKNSGEEYTDEDYRRDMMESAHEYIEELNEEKTENYERMRTEDQN